MKKNCLTLPQENFSNYPKKFVTFPKEKKLSQITPKIVSNYPKICLKLPHY